MTKFPLHIQDLLQKRYLLSGEAYKACYGKEGRETTWDELATRVAKTVAKSDAEFAEFHRIINNLEFLPNSPTLFGAGVPGITLSACFVIKVTDSIDGWAETFRTAMKVQCAGGGCGFATGKLRPKGSQIKGKQAKAAGPVDFMQAWNEMSSVLRQAVRSGANLSCVPISHPDIEEFIKCKDDTSKLTQFNISVLVTDKFMEAVKTKASFNLEWEGKVAKTISAIDLWNSLCEHAHRTGEPGILFIDAINKNNEFRYSEGDLYANPCVTGDTRLHTNMGMLTVAELFDRQSAIKASVDKRTLGIETGVVSLEASKVFKTSESSDVYKISTHRGYEITATKYHEFYSNKGKVKLSELAPGDYVWLQSGTGQFGKYGDHDLGFSIGFFMADGCLSKNGAIFPFFGNKKLFQELVLDRLNKAIKDIKGNNGVSHTLKLHNNSRGHTSIESILVGKFLESEFGINKETKLKIPEKVFRGTKSFVVGFLKGLFSGDATLYCNDKHCDVRLWSTNRKLLIDTQILLANFGVVSKVYLGRKAKVSTITGANGKEYNSPCKDRFILLITGGYLKKFFDEIGFYDAKTNNKFSNWYSNRKVAQKLPYSDKIAAIDLVGKDSTYCVTQPDHNSVIFNGIVTGQCAEANLFENSACNLGSINLTKFLDEQAEGRWLFNVDRFQRCVGLAYRFLDNIIDKNTYPTEAIDKQVKRFRQIGLGLMGFADVFLRMGFVYGDAESIKLTETICKLFKTACDDMNFVLAKEYGSFPMCESKTKRNFTATCIAPTGSISQIAGCSQGIEPHFSFDDYVRVISGNKVNVEGPKKSHNPEANVTANEVSVRAHIDITAAAQKYIDMSISKTINLPSKATVEQVKQAYEAAYEAGIKGITVYRDGSRENQTLQTKEAQEPKKDVKDSKERRTYKYDAISPIPRSEELTGVTKKYKIGCGNLYVTVNYDDQGRIVECFVRSGKYGGCSSNVEAIGRTASLAFRAGVKISEVIDQLSGVRCLNCKSREGVVVHSCSDAIARTIKSVDAKLRGETATEDPKPKAKGPNRAKCPEPDCTGEVYNIGGCVTCKVCGWSKCG